MFMMLMPMLLFNDYIMLFNVDASTIEYGIDNRNDINDNNNAFDYADDWATYFYIAMINVYKLILLLLSIKYTNQ